jgi:TonB family protein
LIAVPARPAAIGFAVLAIFATARLACAQDFVSIFNATDLTGWKVENVSGDVHDGVVRVGNGSGWVRTERPYSDFVLKLDVRAVGDGAHPSVFVRSWPTFDQTSTPNNAYRVIVNASSEPDGWHHIEVECVGHTMNVRLDGSNVYSSDTIDNPQGFLALNASSGSAEFRSIEIKEYPVPKWDVPAGVFSQKDHVVFPRALVMGKPRYTKAALAAKIQGPVLLTGVVEADGTIDHLVVRRSLDPRYGLDDEAIAAAKTWRFTPGTLDGQPIPVLVSLELTFTLK